VGLHFPRSGLAPTPVQAEAGALIVKSYGLGWWLDRDFHGLTVSEANCDRYLHADFILSEAPLTRGFRI
jgi:hypothetical protein